MTREKMSIRVIDSENIHDSDKLEILRTLVLSNSAHKRSEKLIDIWAGKYRAPAGNLTLQELQVLSERLHPTPTPAEVLGYAVGEMFLIKGAPQGEGIFQLFKDDGSDRPLFLMVAGTCDFNNANCDPGAYFGLQYVTRISIEEV